MNRWRREWLAGNPACRAQQPHAPRVAEFRQRGPWRPTPPHLPPWCIPSTWRAHAAHYLNEAGQHRQGLVTRTTEPNAARLCVYTAEHLRTSTPRDRSTRPRAFLPA